jgi:hypothetical protein
MEVFTSSGTWVIPSGVTKCKVTVVGGGQGVGPDSPTSGGTSSFGSFCSATGGGAGGIGVNGTLNISGGYGVGGGGTVNGDGFDVTLPGGGTIFGNGSYGAGGPGLLSIRTVDVYAPDYASGSGGGTAIRIISSGLGSSFVAVTVGAGGGNTSSGNAGVVIVEY